MVILFYILIVVGIIRMRKGAQKNRAAKQKHLQDLQKEQAELEKLQLDNAERKAAQLKAEQKEKEKEAQREKEAKEAQRKLEKEEQERAAKQEVERKKTELQEQAEALSESGLNECCIDATQNDVDISEKGLRADLCTGVDRMMTTMEFENRRLAGNFMGFNMFTQEKEGVETISLCYSGQPIATIEKRAEEVAEGETAKFSYRVNTFSPTLKDGMLSIDLLNMVDAKRQLDYLINEHNPDIKSIREKMVDIISAPDNQTKFKKAIAPRISKKFEQREAQEMSQKKNQSKGQTLKV